MTLVDTVASRACEAAGQAGFGAWARTFRVNSRHDWNQLLNTAVTLLILPWPFFAMGIFSDLPGWAAIGCATVGLLFLSIGSYFLREILQTWHSGRAFIHLFANGAVLERTRGAILTLPYTSRPIDHVTWRESIGDGGERTRTHL